MLQLTTHFPDPGIRLTPILQCLVDLLVQDLPDAVVQAVGCLEVKVDGVEQRTPDIVLLLRVRGIPDPHRTGVGISRQVVELALDELFLAPDSVHDLDVVFALYQIGDEGEEVHCLPIETQCVEAPQGERGVPDPGEAVVVVAVSSRSLGK